MAKLSKPRYPIGMTVEELAEKYGVTDTLLRRMDQMLQIFIGMEYLSIDQKTHLVNTLLAKSGQGTITEAQKSCFTTKTPLSLHEIEIRLNADEFVAMSHALGQTEAWKHIESELQNVVGFMTPVIEESTIDEMNQKAADDWEKANDEWAAASENWEKEEKGWDSNPEDSTPSRKELAEDLAPDFKLKKIDPEQLLTDTWEVGILVFDPIHNSHHLTLLKSGIREQRIVPNDYGMSQNGDIDKSAGALKQWGRTPMLGSDFEDLANGSHCPHIADKQEWALTVASKSGNFDRIFLITIQLEQPNPSFRQESAATKDFSMEKTRHFKFKGLGACSLVEGRAQWPGSLLIQDAEDTAKSGWGIFTMHGKHRSISEKWQTRGGWKINFAQLKGPLSETAIRIHSAGGARLSISGSGNHHGVVNAHAAAFASIGKPGKAEIRLQSSAPPTDLVWENTIDYHTESLKISDSNREIDLSNHCVSFQESRRPTIGGTLPFDSCTSKNLNGAISIQGGSLVGHFVAEAKLIHQNKNMDQQCDFIGQAKSEWVGEIDMDLPMTPTESISFQFGPGEEKEVTISKTENGRIETSKRIGVCLIKGPDFEWAIDQVSQTQIHTWHHNAKTSNTGQQGWADTLEKQSSIETVDMQVSLGRTKSGFRLRKSKA